ncbi:Na+/H+ antiporter subunit E [soil metagenome]|uniref:cation:proton antiporter n=1 Tax=Leptolyngbya sp. BC1307 TaxID=2029589 RepID=UPI000EFB0141|nr:cation:proton antiporter [Leptolyngbya sp. BC1307]
MIGYRDLLLRLSIWFLLTADLSLANIVIGVSLALLLPKFGARSYAAPDIFKDWLQILWKIVVAVPKAYFEAFEMILHPHEQEEITLEPSESHRTPGLIFLDIFLVTFTPKTIVVRRHADGQNEVHWVKRRRRP